VDLADAVSYHQLALQAEGRSPATLRLYLLYQRRFLEYLALRGIPPTLEALNALNVRQSVLWFQARRYGARDGQVATAVYLNTLKTWASFLEREGVWSVSPLRQVKRVTVRHLEREPYTRQEVAALLQVASASRAPERDRLLLTLLLETGARSAEIAGLQTADVSFARRTVRVLGKGNRERTIPVGVASQSDGGPLFRAQRAYLPVRARQAARAPERVGERLLLTVAGYPLTPDGVADVVKRLGDAAGVAGAIPHRFRHTYATLYLTTYPGDEIGLRRLLGHLSDATLRDYVHLSQLALAQRAGRVSPTEHWLSDTRARP
jgi:site-specific recombinase XerD